MYIMGCDYYILKLLRIYYSDSDYLEVELERERGYYDDLQFDEDADDYEEKINEHIRQTLLPKTEPILIYSNGEWNKSLCETKYKGLIENELNIVNKNWQDVTKVIKLEYRHER
jgi:hypothetical protein